MSLYSQAMVNVQMLSELEEIIQFKLVPERREAIKRTWWNRLQVSDENSVSSFLGNRMMYFSMRYNCMEFTWCGFEL